MMSRCFLLLMVVAFSYVHAQESDDAFSERMKVLVGKGNKEYDRSYRQGIKLYADSIEHSLQRRSAAGLLGRMDSLEYTADVYKLRGDWHYENSNYNEASYAKAEEYFKKASEIYNSESAFNGNRHNAPMIDRELAQLHYKQERYAEALEHTQMAYEAFSEDYDLEEFVKGDEDYETYLDLKSQLAMCQMRMGNNDEALRLIEEVLAEYPKNSAKYNEVLRKKAKIITLKGEGDFARKALELYKQYFQWIREDALRTLTNMTAEEREGYWMRMRPFVTDCYQTESADPKFLYDVTLFNKGLLLQINRLSGHGTASTSALSSLKYTWEQIQKQLPANCCAIEFVQYEKQGEQKLGAIVLRKKGNPQWVEMLSPNDFMAHQSYGKTNRERIYNTSGRAKDALYNDSAFYSQIWNDDLLKAIRGCKKAYFAPDGYLHQVAIEYMIPDELSQTDFYRLTSTRRLMESGGVKTDAALIVGGVMYNAPTTGGDTWGNDDAAYSYLYDKHANFNYLEGSLAEADTIRILRSVLRDTLLTGSMATEQAFRQLCGKYPIVNISTHGYFGAAEVPQGTDIKACLSDESLSQCMLALAGANTSLSAEAFDTRCLDGIVSAHELSALDCSNVDLAVVASCQTALGYVTADGVYGIQRGLKNAGVGSMLVSLWNVDDVATRQLISRFHKNLRDGMTVHQAFKAARTSLLSGWAKGSGISWEFDPATMAHRRKQTEKTYAEPMYSDAFILIDAIE